MGVNGVWIIPGSVEAKGTLPAASIAPATQAAASSPFDPAAAKPSSIAFNVDESGSRPPVATIPFSILPAISVFRSRSASSFSVSGGGSESGRVRRAGPDVSNFA
jgi:hypothetical protein